MRKGVLSLTPRYNNSSNAFIMVRHKFYTKFNQTEFQVILCIKKKKNHIKVGY